MPFELFKQIFIITFHFLRLKIFVDKSNLFSRKFFFYTYDDNFI